jgi:hypothetical protein
MADAVLFTQPDPRRGPAATNLFRVKRMTEIVLTVDGMEWRYPKGTVRRKPGAETEITLLRDDDAPLDLASVPGAIAAAVIVGEDGWLCWFGDGQCLLTEPCRTMALARSEVEGHCCPKDGYEL